MDFRRHMKICQYFLQGRCKFGSSCRYLHQGLQTYLIRHAISQYNVATQTYCRQGSKYYSTQKQPENFNEINNQKYYDVYSQDAKVFQLNQKLIDCNLTETGKKQIQNIGYSNFLQQKLEVDIIFVSPLERALQTAAMLLDNKKVSTSRVIVFPQLTQVMSKICDFGNSIAQKMKKYPKFDFQLFFMNVQQTKNKEEMENFKKQALIKWQDKFISNPSLKPDEEKQYGERYLEILKNIFPEPLESSEQCFNRVLEAIEKIKKISEVCQARRIMIVSHNRTLKYFCGRFNRGIAKSFQNCEIRKVYL